MNYLGKFISNFRDFYNEINSATLTGAIDVIVIKQPDDTYVCSPFHVRFGKIGVLRSREKVVDIEVNGEPVDIHMKLGESGEAFFVQEVEDENDEIPVHLATSPLPLVPDIGEELRKMKALPEYRNGEVMDTEIPDQSGIIHSSSTLPSLNESHPAKDVLDPGGQVHGQENGLVASCVSFPSSPIDTSNIPVLSNVSEGLKGESVSIQTESLSTGFVSKEHEVSESETMDGTTKLVNGCSEDPKTRKKKRKRPRKYKMSSTVTPRQSCTDQDTHSSETDDLIDKPGEIFQMSEDEHNEEDEGYPSALNGIMYRSVSLPVAGNQFAQNEWPLRKISSTFTGEFHPFSDGDVTPLSSPTGSRPPSPKSDTEYEIQKHDAVSQTDTGEPIWGWGELPNVPRRQSDIQLPTGVKTDSSSKAVEERKVEDTSEAEKRTVFSGLFTFMHTTRKYRHNPESEGIYLDDINPDELDPEVTALYFPRFRTSYYPQNVISPAVRDEDAESGNGPSLPHSPHSVAGAIGGQDSDIDDRHSFDYCSDVAMSLCGGLQDSESELPEERFLHSLVTYDEFTENPSILQNANLVIRLSGKYYNWQTAAPMLLSIMMFQRPLPEKTVNQLVDEHMPKKKKSKSYSSWWYWRRSEAEVKKPEPVLPIEAVVTESSPADSQSVSTAAVTPSSDSELKNMNIDQENSTVISISSSKADESLSELKSVDDLGVTSVPEKQTEVMLFPPSSSSSSCGSPTDPTAFDSNTLRPQANIPALPSTAPKPIGATYEENKSSSEGKSLEKYKKSLRLTSEQIASLKLKEGSNEVVFSVTTAYQGTTRCTCHIYLWNYDDKIVISDIDGTITKSDVLGHLMPIIGRDWAQLGVTKLFTKVKNNGYQFLYLSARAIGQSRSTRDYLRSVRQGDICLPDGPLLLSPTSLISALHREVIERKPEEFKISCLKDIQTLFPTCMGNPFYAGFGNRINDTWAYRAVGIPLTRVFTINHRGELKLELIQTFQSSYTRLSDVVDHMFPPLERCNTVNGHLAPSFTASEEYSYFTFWRDPVAAISEDDLAV